MTRPWPPTSLGAEGRGENRGRARRSRRPARQLGAETGDGAKIRTFFDRHHARRGDNEGERGTGRLAPDPPPLSDPWYQQETNRWPVYASAAESGITDSS